MFSLRSLMPFPLASFPPFFCESQFHCVGFLRQASAKLHDDAVQESGSSDTSKDTDRQLSSPVRESARTRRFGNILAPLRRKPGDFPSEEGGVDEAATESIQMETSEGVAHSDVFPFRNSCPLSCRHHEGTGSLCCSTLFSLPCVA